VRAFRAGQQQAEDERGESHQDGDDERDMVDCLSALALAEPPMQRHPDRAGADQNDENGEKDSVVWPHPEMDAGSGGAWQGGG
ncbi:MAG: hypothetical protein WCB94_19815, partial [Terriglobales bacterium]